MEQKIFAIFCYNLKGELISLLHPDQAPVEGLYEKTEPMTYNDLRMRGTMVKDWLETKQIDFMGHRFTFNGKLELTRVEKMVFKQVYP